MEKELVQKYYIERRMFGTLDFIIVSGTVGKSMFMVKERDYIVGFASPSRIYLNSEYLFDDFETAAKRFTELTQERIEGLQQEIDNSNSAINTVEELLKQVKG